MHVQNPVPDRRPAEGRCRRSVPHRTRVHKCGMKDERLRPGSWGRFELLKPWWEDVRAFFTVWGHSWRQTVVQIKKQPCVYCLGLFSCLTTVMITAAVQSTLEKTPVIFLQEGERERGQVRGAGVSHAAPF